MREKHELSLEEETKVENVALKYAMYNAFVFVGGGLILAWILLFVFYSIR